MKVPYRLWDYLIVWVCETDNLTVSSSKYANGRTPLELMTGETPDISEYVDFSFYDWVNYRPNAGLGEPSIGRWLGVSHKIGNLMSYWILTMSGNVISCTTVSRVTSSEKNTDEYKTRMMEYSTRMSNALTAQNTDVSNM